MTPQQRATSSLSIGNLSMTGFSTYQQLSPLQQTPSNNQIGTQPTSSVSPQTPTIPVMQTQIQLPSNSQSSDVVSSSIINSTIAFPQCVQLLHYCRLVYKCYNFGKSSKSCVKLNPYLCNWLLSLMS